jgi:hypothetical protein
VSVKAISVDNIPSLLIAFKLISFTVSTKLCVIAVSIESVLFKRINILVISTILL